MTSRALSSASEDGESRPATPLVERDGRNAAIGIGDIEQLLAPLAVAVERQCCTIAQGMWRRLEPAALLPFQLHGPWCDRIPRLALNSRFGMIPFTSQDWAVGEQERYDPTQLRHIRGRARARRGQQGNYCAPDDLKVPDWEEGLGKHAGEAGSGVLAGRSFLAIETIRSDGSRAAASRPVLGRYAHGYGPRPTLRVPGRVSDADSQAALAVLADTDLLVINLQELRGARSAAFARAALRARGPNRPTLVIAASPSDLLFLNEPHLVETAVVMPVGEGPAGMDVVVRQVGCDRPQAERELDLTLRSLVAESPVMDRLIKLGMAAWWAANQSLALDPSDDYAVRRFLSAMERLEQGQNAQVQELRAFSSLLLRTCRDEQRRGERSTALTNAIEQHLNEGSGDTVVIVRDHASARALAGGLAQRLACATQDLREYRVFFRTGRALVPTERPGLTVVSGFSGFTTLDALLASRAPKALLVIDPIEAALAVTIATRVQPWLVRVGFSAGPLDALRNAAASIAQRPDGTAMHVEFDVFHSLQLGTSATTSGAGTPGATDSQRLVITFLDGESLVVDASRRFDRVDTAVGRSRAVPASDLEIGDEVVLTDDASVFAEKLIESMDKDVLASEARKREMWVRTVEIVAQSTGVSIAAVHRRLEDVGVHIDYQSVRAWLRPGEQDDRVPARREHFKKLAEVLGLAMTEEELLGCFEAIRVLRVRHRKAGRDLVRMMRAARTGRLDPGSLRRVERLFGVGVRDLIEATRLAVVDDVQVEV